MDDTDEPKRRGRPPKAQAAGVTPGLDPEPPVSDTATVANPAMITIMCTKKTQHGGALHYKGDTLSYPGNAGIPRNFKEV